jgi:hypothetical protein
MLGVTRIGPSAKVKGAATVGAGPVSGGLVVVVGFDDDTDSPVLDDGTVTVDAGAAVSTVGLEDPTADEPPQHVRVESNTTMAATANA